MNLSLAKLISCHQSRQVSSFSPVTVFTLVSMSPFSARDASHEIDLRSLHKGEYRLGYLSSRHASRLAERGRMTHFLWYCRDSSIPPQLFLARCGSVVRAQLINSGRGAHHSDMSNYGKFRVTLGSSSSQCVNKRATTYCWRVTSIQA